MDLPQINVRWSSAIPMDGADASPLPNRGGVYEILFHDTTGVDRMYVGETEDLRRAFVSHVAGSKGAQQLRRSLASKTTFFRYWLCEIHGRRLEVVAALADLHFYESGHQTLDDGVLCAQLIETE